MIPRTFCEYSWAGGGTAVWAVCRSGTAVTCIVRWFVVQKTFTKGRKNAVCSGMTPVPTTSYCSAARLPTPTPLSFEKVTEFISASKDQTINTSALDKVRASCPCRVPSIQGFGWKWFWWQFQPLSSGKKWSCQGIEKKEWEVAEHSGKGWFMCSIISPRLAIAVF